MDVKHQLKQKQTKLFFLQVFRCVAFRSRNREDILAGIKEFSRYLTVLPPGTWDPTTRIEPLDSVPQQVRPLSLPQFITLIRPCNQEPLPQLNAILFYKKKRFIGLNLILLCFTLILRLFLLYAYLRYYFSTK